MSAALESKRELVIKSVILVTRFLLSRHQRRVFALSLGKAGMYQLTPLIAGQCLVGTVRGIGCRIYGIA
ncbi:MAG: hypothetical protein ACYDHW_13835 [Syntrophorhabdaceae bacterium]